MLIALLVPVLFAGTALQPPAGESSTLGALEDFDASFGFLAPGATTPAVALKKIGAPAADYPAWTDGKMDFEIQIPTPDSIARLPPARTEVRVLEWYDSRDATRPAAKLVFRKDVLWYALVPFTASESSPSKLEARFGAKPTVSTETRADGDFSHVLTLYAYPGRGIAYVHDDARDGSTGPSFRTKVVFAPAK
jgi:hypothetical protein